MLTDRPMDGQSDGRMDGWIDGHTLLYRCDGASKKIMILMNFDVKNSNNAIFQLENS